MIKRMIWAAISAAAFVALTIAFAPTVATAFAHSRPTINEATPKQPVAERSCAAFEVWFLDPACSKVRAKKAARTKHHLAHNGSLDGSGKNRFDLGAQWSGFVAVVGQHRVVGMRPKASRRAGSRTSLAKSLEKKITPARKVPVSGLAGEASERPLEVSTPCHRLAQIRQLVN